MRGLLLASFFFCFLAVSFAFAFDECSPYIDWPSCSNDTDSFNCIWNYNDNLSSYICTNQSNVVSNMCNMLGVETCWNNSLYPGKGGCFYHNESGDDICLVVDGPCFNWTLSECEEHIGCELSSDNLSCVKLNASIANGSIPQANCSQNCSACMDHAACNSSMAGCFWNISECIDGSMPMSIDCSQFDYNESGCISAGDGQYCNYNSTIDICYPKGFEDCFDCHYNCDFNESCHAACDQMPFCEGAGPSYKDCYRWDGNETGCIEQPECIWKPGSSPETGLCDPKDMDFSGDSQCFQYDGKKDACLNAKNFGEPCEWHHDPWGPLFKGTEHGFCDPVMGGGKGCWDFKDMQSCNLSAQQGMPCEWKWGSSSGFCEKKGCWDYANASECNLHSGDGCSWDQRDGKCYELVCWDLNQSSCESSSSFGLNCSWHTSTYGGGWCEENGCWLYDWTNKTICESAPMGCNWDPFSNYCNEKGCWDLQDEASCTSSSMDCRWKNEAWGWCEQKGCWSYNSNQTECENSTKLFGLKCTWDSLHQECYEAMQSCSDYNGNQKGCYGTKWCFWDPSGNNGTGTCNMPDTPSDNFINPDCWFFSKADSSKCNNITVCSYDSASHTCQNDGVGPSGIQCSDINDSVFCNSIPMLSSCCKWNGTGCAAAPFSTSCWDNMQQPPAGAMFCDDYNSKYSESLCNQIAGNPWYMPCYWDNSSKECRFAFDNFFGGSAEGFSFSDIGSKANCESMGGAWKSETWTDQSGKVYADERCELGFGHRYETCDTACWACEFPSNSSLAAWNSTEQARAKCEASKPGKCVFRQDSNAPNGYGWCDLNFEYSGNCNQNCWDCWSSEKCKASPAGCKWFIDPFNTNKGWCDSKNARTCNDDCGLCWDMENCGNSPAGCTWDSDYWFCKPQGTGQGGASSEICFDGMDNDGDNFIDCADPGCNFNDFCGGSTIFGSNCLSITQEQVCNSTSGCVWITDHWNNSWCDMEGSQCWLYDTNASACDAEPGCHYSTMNQTSGASAYFCDVNFTKVDSAKCWDYHNMSDCSSHSAEGCAWVADKWCSSPEGQSDPWCASNPGWCDYQLWSCHEYGENRSGCESDSECGWTTDWFNPDMGWCDPVCFTRNSTDCEADVGGEEGVCWLINASEKGWCESDKMFRGCWDYADKAGCDSNDACQWIENPFAGDFCSDKFMQSIVGGMDKSPPLELVHEGCSPGQDEHKDICFLGLKDDFESLGLGTAVYSMANAAACSKFGMTGNRTTKFYWYLDANGVETGGCSPNDNLSMEGFDFKFRYEASMISGKGSELKVAYKCSNGIWSPSVIKLTSWPEQMCFMLPGGMVAVSKEDLEKMRVLGLYNKSAIMRIYATTSGSGGNSSRPFDRIGPAWYKPGTADFRFEDCLGFTDSDGDGLLPSEDPDCTKFLRKGYIEAEKGTDCSDGIDNDGNSLADCEDPGCMYDPYFCTPPSDDKKAPAVTWLNIKKFKEGAFIELNTDEPTNATLFFFRNDSYCRNRSSAIRIRDPKLGNAFAIDDYDLWHGLPCDNKYFNENGIPFQAAPNTTYYFKSFVCDKAGLCAISACSSFRTKATGSQFTVGFDLPPPADDPTVLLGVVHVRFGFSGTGAFADGTIEGASGKKLNETQGRDINLQFTNPNASKQWGIDFMGSDFKQSQKLNISDAFIVNESNSTVLVGIKKDKWNEMAQKLGVDYVRIVIPQGIDTASYSGAIVKCPDNVSTASVPPCISINLSDANCSFAASATTCDIPTSIGFSVFAVMNGAFIGGGDGDGDGDTSTSGGSTGGAAAPATSLKETTKSKMFQGIPAGVRTEFAVGSDLIGISKLSFTLSRPSSMVSIEVSSLSKLPDSVPILAREAYQFLQIEHSNLNSVDLSSSAEIEFRVKKSWMSEKGAVKEAIRLYRHADGEWKELRTEYLSSGSTWVDFKAYTPGFSYFAIAAAETDADDASQAQEQGQIQAQDEQQAEPAPSPIEGVTGGAVSDETHDEGSPSSEKSGLEEIDQGKMWLWVLIGLAIVGTAYLLAFRVGGEKE